jgi:hypothetical protein
MNYFKPKTEQDVRHLFSTPLFFKKYPLIYLGAPIFDNDERKTNPDALILDLRDVNRPIKQCEFKFDFNIADFRTADNPTFEICIFWTWGTNDPLTRERKKKYVTDCFGCKEFICLEEVFDNLLELNTPNIEKLSTFTSSIEKLKDQITGRSRPGREHLPRHSLQALWIILSLYNDKRITGLIPHDSINGFLGNRYEMTPQGRGAICQNLVQRQILETTDLGLTYPLANNQFFLNLALQITKFYVEEIGEIPIKLIEFDNFNNPQIINHR